MKFEFRKGFTELVLIFVGITLALAFENLNNDRERRVQELKLLSELLQDLDETQLDLKRDIGSAENKLRFIEPLLLWFNGEENTYAEFSFEFAGVGRICGLPGLFPKDSAYESIKTIGLDLISHDVIRASTSSLFELSLTRVAHIEGEFKSDSRTYCYPFFNSNFIAASDVEFSERQVNSITAGATVLGRSLSVAGYLPFDAAALRQDQKERNIVIKLYRDTATILSTYQQVDTEIDELRNLIVEELEN